MKKVFPINNIEHLLVIGDVEISYYLLYSLCEMGIPITIMDDKCFRIGEMLPNNPIDSKNTSASAFTYKQYKGFASSAFIHDSKQGCKA